MATISTQPFPTTLLRLCRARPHQSFIHQVNGQRFPDHNNFIGKNGYPLNQKADYFFLLRAGQLLKNAENEVENSCMYEGPTAGYEPYLSYRYIITNKKYTQNCLVVEELFESGPAKG